MWKKILITIMLLIGYIYWGTNALEVNYFTLVDEEIPSEFSGMKIAHVSDLHNKDFGRAIIDKVAIEEPDLIAVTGDLIDSNFRILPLLWKPLRVYAQLHLSIM